MPSAIQEGSARTASAATQMLAYSATSQNTRPQTCFTSRADTATSLNAVTAVSVTHSCASEMVPCSGVNQACVSAALTASASASPPVVHVYGPGP